MARVGASVPFFLHSARAAAGDFKIISAANVTLAPALCISDPNGGMEEFLQLQLSPCGEGSATLSSQVWTYSSATQTFANRNSGLCLQVVYPGTKHVTLVQGPCFVAGAPDPTQQWSVTGGSALHPLSDTTQCLDVKGGMSAQSGSVLVLSACYGAPTQQWAFERESWS